VKGNARRAAFTVALVGPDGCGKTTIARELEGALPMPIAYLYMGVSPESSNRVLPTTWLVRSLRKGTRDAAGRGPSGSRPRPRGLVRRAAAELRAVARLCNRLAEECYRQLLTWRYKRRGTVVIYDRHFYADFFGVMRRGGDSWTVRLHLLFLEHLYPKPDLVLYLDAPPELLFARKGEGTLESIAALRADYRRLADVTSDFVTLDASAPLELVVKQAAEEITRFAQRRSG
jgi:thymidylate kinase